MVSQFQGSTDLDRVLSAIEEEGYTGVTIAAAEGEFEARSLLHEFVEDVTSGYWYGEVQS